MTLWRSMEPEAGPAVIDWDKVKADADRSAGLPSDPYVLHPDQYARWKANGWIR